VSEIAPREKIGTYSGLSLFIIGLGTIIGAPLSGVIIDITSSYNDMWYVMASALVVMSILILVFSRLFSGKRYGKASVANVSEDSTGQ
jgi:MFS family permease